MQPERREAKTKAEVESNVAASPEMIAVIRGRKRQGKDPPPGSLEVWPYQHP